jgi:hypothetical protein
MRRTPLLLVAFAIVAASACGGSGKRAPKPLQHHLDDVHIARVPVASKQEVVRAQNDHAVARMEHNKATSDLEDIDTTIRIARNEREQAVLSESSARSEKDAADRSNDMNRINRAARALRTAELERRAADERVEYLRLQRRALEAYVRFTGEDVYAKEARYEYAKARVARQHNIQPQGFDYNAFKQQAELRAQQALEAKADADRAEHAAAEAREKWQNLVREAQRMRSGSSHETSAR